MHTERVIPFWRLLIVLTLITLASPAYVGESQSAEQKVAVVNGTVINQPEFDNEMNRVLERLQRTGRFPNDLERSQIKKQVLENLIARELLYQESQTKGIKVDQKEIEAQVTALKGRFPSEVEFKNALSTMNLTEADLRFQFERDLAIRKLLDDQIGDKVAVSEKESKAYYDNNLESFKKPEQVRASHILIKVDPGAEEAKKAEARTKIESVQAKLKKGEDFGALAKEYSEGPSGPKGGDLGFFGRGQMVKPFEEAAFSMKPGQVSGMVETRFGYHLIMVAERTPESTLSYEEVKDRLEQYLKQQKVQEAIAAYVETLQGKAKIERFVKEG
ncbi:MAG: peptidylprolyl isomerase [Deltaproteobacteria bacterium]|jgi:peptidyl-prolyl cis-trans isomerase C|nr:peptidylprolyl isomerase [Deltaproteobacteria bacterium]MDH3773925.1 peptidylprolyl isomerase [Deltaproteobacteria bacterium]MDH3800651.1 peptidylprolyl isomerase [Deltaproteobacteria bacterium]MDH3851989.1 peptidylprolyl isomerase [Deltaproteobacteria bacterium]MDH3896178.1 peptidylprolyl isomerase [Deltaproteobacteria bacterium]